MSKVSIGIFIPFVEEDHWDLIEARLIKGGASFTLFTILGMWSGDEAEAGPFVAWVTCPNREEEDKVIAICNAPLTEGEMRGEVVT